MSGDTAALAGATRDFIFGTLATDELRLAALTAAARDLIHQHRLDPPDPAPGEPVRLTATAGVETSAERVYALYTLDGSEPGPDAARVDFAPGAVIWETLTWGYRQEWTGTLPPQPEGTLVQYRIAAESDGTTRWADVDPETGRPATFAYVVDRERVPAWLRDAVIYQIFVDRFRPGAGRDWNPVTRLDDIWGGTLRGVIEALPYLSDLGVTCLWLSPVFPSPTHHGYDATDYFSVEPRLGTEDDLVELFQAAHARGMRVLLDFVANHVSDEHPRFRRAAADPAAPERAWFTFDDSPLGYRSFFGVASMPQLDLTHPAARDELLAAATHWLELGADGYRLDYAHGPSHAFWSRFRAATRQAKGDSASFGEVVETAELQRSYQGRLDGTLDFLLLQQIRACFAFESISLPAFARFLDRHLAYFPPDFVLPSFLDNHDMNRFLWAAGGDTRRLKLAALCQFTLPHPPIVYYGTEVGLSQFHDLEYPDGSRRMEESRTPMPWGDERDLDLLAFYRALIALRRRLAPLWRGTRTTLLPGADSLSLVSITHDRTTAWLALNRSGSQRSLPLPPGARLALATQPVRTDDTAQISLPPLAGAILVDTGEG